MSQTPATLRSLDASTIRQGSTYSQHGATAVGDTIDPNINNSSYLGIPNYPFKEPLFYVPRIPTVTKVPEPKAPKRPPPPGYDMRTLRKQLEFLNDEIEDKVHTQTLLYKQNEQLWMYIQDLLEANKANAQLMRNEVVRLHTELKTAHRARYELAEKLDMARNSKQMLVDLHRDLRESQLTVEEIEKRKAEAEEALLLAKQDNSTLEETLHTQMSTMQGIHNELEDFRQRRREEEALDTADEYFYTSRTVLRAAYYRFRSGVQARFRLGRIYATVHAAYQHYLKTLSVENWRQFLARRRLMHVSRSKRRREQLSLCLAQWKVYAALERLFTRSRRRLLLRRVFAAWRQDAKESTYDAWALDVTAQLQQVQRMRRVFTAWQKNTCFLDWYNPMHPVWAQQAGAHFLRTLLKHWRRVATSAQEQWQYLSQERVPKVVTYYHFTRWHQLCGTVWRRRGRLLRRFFRNMKVRVVERDERAVTRKYAYSCWIALNQRKVLRKWCRFVRTRRMFVSGIGDGSGGGGGDGFLATIRTIDSIMEGGGGEGGGSGGGGGGSSNVSDLLTTPMTNTAPSSGGNSNTAAGNNGAGAGATTGMSVAATVASAISSAGANRRLSFLTAADAGTLTVNSTTGKTQTNKTLVKRRQLVKKKSQAGQQHQTRSMAVMSHMKRRWLRSSMLIMVYISSVQRRQRLCLQAGMRHYICRIATGALRLWRSNVKAELRVQRRQRRFLLRTVFQGWQQFLEEEKRETLLAAQMVALAQRVQQRWHRGLLNRWQQHSRRRVQLLRCYAHISQKHVVWGMMATAFQNWRRRWSSSLYWRLKELQIEYTRTRSLNDLNKLAIEDMETANQKGKSVTKELEETVMGLQENLAEHNNKIAEQTVAIQEREKEKETLLSELKEAQQQLHDVTAEAERLKVFESMLSSKLHEQAREKALLEAAAADVVARVKQESYVLRHEVQEAREQSVLAEKQAEAEILRNVTALEAAQEEARTLQELLSDKKEYLSQLEDEQQGLLHGLEGVQSKLVEVTGDGASLIAENEALIRSRGSAVRVLSSNAGLAEARVKTLQQMVDDFRADVDQMQLSEVLDAEHSELLQLQELQQQLEAHQQQQQQRHHHHHYGLGEEEDGGSSSVGNGLSLYHNHLSPSPSAARSSAANKRSSAATTTRSSHAPSYPQHQLSLAPHPHHHHHHHPQQPSSSSSPSSPPPPFLNTSASAPALLLSRPQAPLPPLRMGSTGNTTTTANKNNHNHNNHNNDNGGPGGGALFATATQDLYLSGLELKSSPHTSSRSQSRRKRSARHTNNSSRSSSSSGSSDDDDGAFGNANAVAKNSRAGGDNQQQHGGETFSKPVGSSSNNYNYNLKKKKALSSPTFMTAALDTDTDISLGSAPSSSSNNHRHRQGMFNTTTTTSTTTGGGYAAGWMNTVAAGATPAAGAGSAAAYTYHRNHYYAATTATAAANTASATAAGGGSHHSRSHDDYDGSNSSDGGSSMLQRLQPAHSYSSNSHHDDDEEEEEEEGEEGEEEEGEEGEGDRALRSTTSSSSRSAAAATASNGAGIAAAAATMIDDDGDNVGGGGDMYAAAASSYAQVARQEGVEVEEEDGFSESVALEAEEVDDGGGGGEDDDDEDGELQEDEGDEGSSINASDLRDTHGADVDEQEFVNDSGTEGSISILQLM